ncbi:hypothetical protein [Saccharopolyspora sp. NPDC002376]
MWADATLLVLNLVFLFRVALLPFPAEVLDSRHGDPTAAVVIYREPRHDRTELDSAVVVRRLRSGHASSRLGA